MSKKYNYIEDDFELDKYKEEFSKTVEENYYQKNKIKFSIAYLFVMIASVAIAFFLYGLLQDWINILTGMS